MKKEKPNFQYPTVLSLQMIEKMEKLNWMLNFLSIR